MTMPTAHLPAESAEKLEQMLSKLVWQVLYGKSIDAASAAAHAEEFLSHLKAGRAA